jgi:hypothetical protein
VSVKHQTMSSPTNSVSAAKKRKTSIVDTTTDINQQTAGDVYYIISMDDVPLDICRVPVMSGEEVSSIKEKIMIEHHPLFEGVPKLKVQVFELSASPLFSVSNKTIELTTITKLLRSLQKWSEVVTWGTLDTPILIKIVKRATGSICATGTITTSEKLTSNYNQLNKTSKDSSSDQHLMKRKEEPSEEFVTTSNNGGIHRVCYIILSEDVPIDTLHVPVVSNETVESILEKIRTKHSILFTGVEKFQLIVLDSRNERNLVRLIDSWNTNVEDGRAIKEEHRLQLSALWSIDATWGTQNAPIIVQHAESETERIGTTQMTFTQTHTHTILLITKFYVLVTSQRLNYHYA